MIEFYSKMVYKKDCYSEKITGLSILFQYEYSEEALWDERSV